MKRIKTVGIVGAGTMGAALAQKFAQEGLKVVLADRTEIIIKKGLENIKRTLDEAIDKNVFKPEEVSSYLANIQTTDKLEELKVCDLIVEAIYENLEAKMELFENLSNIVSADTILATNTSSFSVTEISSCVKHPERFIGLHFFYHAAKNRLVEIIPGEKTSASTFESIKQFCVLAGKDSITCIDAYGFVVNRFFVPWLNEAVRIMEEGIGSKEAIDQVCMKTFGVGMGPFALMNATGISVAYHAEKTLEIFGSLYKVSEALKTQSESGNLWELKTTEDISIDKKTEKQIHDRMLGVVFFVCSQILDEKICSATDIDRGAKIGLRWKKGPIELMNETGENGVTRLIVNIIDIYNMPLPESIGNKYWEIDFVKLEKKGDTAVITMNQPENLNALSEQTFKQLTECFDEADNDATIKKIIITGTGKAFVAGADIKFFVDKIQHNKICEIEEFTKSGQELFERIDNSKKTIIAIINGLALGGGLELALCADIILSLPKAQMAFPETGIGIYPGLGGTQRSVKKIGKGLSKFLIHTGRIISAKEGKEMGLIDEIISLEKMFMILSGEISIDAINKNTINPKWKAISNFFENNSLHDFIDRTYVCNGLFPEDAEKITKPIRYKAPIALKLADKLIDESKGCTSELEYLHEIFSTSDALLGLTSIGKKVSYLGK